MKKSVLIRSLPSEYQSTIFALKAAGLSKITFDDMVQRLKETEVGLKGQDELSQDENLPPPSMASTEHVAAAWGARYQAAFTYQKAVGQPKRQE
ncbi:hypothetical protein M433DRAFT_10157 [Acidomyces richmondensis BFW]|nr:hypothetical protein M433DRAFT_10157 [Acidomyces richmondensis BFW]